jgi:hypothetical protein
MHGREHVPALALALAAVAAGCGSNHHAAPKPTPPRLVPWHDDETTTAPTVAAPWCRAAQLRVVGRGFVLAPAPSGATGAAILRNAGPGACRLEGRARVRLVGASPAPRQTQLALPAQPPTFPAVAPPDSLLQSIPAGGRVTLAIAWSNWCVRAAKRRHPRPRPPRAFLVTLRRGGGHLELGYNGVAPCFAPRRPSTIGVRPYQPAALARTTPWTSQPVAASIEGVTGQPPPLHATHGSDLRYAVRLRNLSQTTISFAHCPLVVEMLAPAGGSEAHRLNCAAARALAPGRSETFEMRIAVPASAPTGANGLFWELDPLGARGPEAVARVLVSG